MVIFKNDEDYMKEALKEAVKALEKGEVPVGAVIVHEGRIIARAHNQIRLLRDPTAHAEMLAITQAAEFFNNERLLKTRLYVTIEPCAMCAGAMVLARIESLFYGAPDPKAGACGSVMNILSHQALNHKVKVKSMVLEEESRLLMKEFFKERRMRVELN
jgi:tRNA(adenine34) deaminase